MIEMLALCPERINPGSLWDERQRCQGVRASEGVIERELGP